MRRIGKVRYAVWIGCVLLLLWGCGEPPKPPPKQVVRKKITQKPDSIEQPAIASSQTQEQSQVTASTTKTQTHDISQKSPVSSSEKQEQVVRRKIPEKPVTESIKPSATSKERVLAGRIGDRTEKETSGEKGMSASEDVRSAARSAERITTSESSPSRSETAETMTEDSKTIASLSGLVDKIATAEYTDGYDPIGKIDPFEPLFREPEAGGKKSKDKEDRKNLSPIEQVDVSQLKLVGIIRSDRGNLALIEESSGKGYVITKGTNIGIHSGKVEEIMLDKVIVAEEELDWAGRVQIRKRELKIQKPPGEDYHEL